ncbi:MAG: hypothetical protein ACREIT_09560, partial [Tepidisphaeraceae bacterium]
HQFWVSPSGKTAYGVIRFTMPLPVGADIVLPFFIAEMRRAEREATLVSKEKDPDLPGVRFVATGGLHTIRVSLITRGFRGWAIYAGSKRGEEPPAGELDLAQRARDHTRVGLPNKGDKGK